MKYRSVFDIIGPIMVGPSSSHTAGAVRIGNLSRRVFGDVPLKVDITLYGSFSKTYKGHGTDVALIAGVLGFDTFDRRIPSSLVIAKDKGIDVNFYFSDEETRHPNTARLKLANAFKQSELVGVSIGGGKVEIEEVDGFKLENIVFNDSLLLILHKDKYGMIERVSNILASWKINISYMQVSRKEKGLTSLMLIKTDEDVKEFLIEEIRSLKDIYNVIFLNI